MKCEVKFSKTVTYTCSGFSEPNRDKLTEAREDEKLRWIVRFPETHTEVTWDSCNGILKITLSMLMHMDHPTPEQIELEVLRYLTR